MYIPILKGGQTGNVLKYPFWENDKHGQTKPWARCEWKNNHLPVKYYIMLYSTSTRPGEGAIYRYLSRQGKIAGDIHETKSSGLSHS